MSFYIFPASPPNLGLILVHLEYCLWFFAKLKTSTIHPAPLTERPRAEKYLWRDRLCNSHYDYSQADRSRARGCRGLPSWGLSPLPPLPSPLPEPPHGQADRLLPKLLHDLLDSCQVGFGDGEVALGSSHVVADFAGLGGSGIAFCLHTYHVFPWVEKTPVIPISSW